MKVLFTKSNTLSSWIIRHVLNEPISHCAILLEDRDIVLHSTMDGVSVISAVDFYRQNEVLFSVDVSDNKAAHQFDNWDVEDMLILLDSPYDFVAFMALGVRALGKRLGINTKKVDVWQLSGMFLCTEFVDAIVRVDESNKLMTPMELYIILSKRY